MSRNKIAVLLVCAAASISYLALNSQDVMAKSPIPAALDHSLARSTENGDFRVRIVSAVEPVPLHKMHQWTVEVTDPAGRPVSDAAIEIGGGMPQHGHGLPTRPIAQASGPAGAYVINGVKFSMGGWWELKLKIAAEGVTDRVTFNLVL